MNYVRIDDKITRVTPLYTVCETVESTTRDNFATKFPSFMALRHEDENVTWVRGWHLPDSEEVTAARAAQALREPAFVPLVPSLPAAPAIPNPMVPELNRWYVPNDLNPGVLQPVVYPFGAPVPTIITTTSTSSLPLTP